MKIIRIDTSWMSGVVTDEELAEAGKRALQANALLHSGEGAGSQYLGWVGLPSVIDYHTLDEIKKTADSLRNMADVIITIGIGGSYLGAKAAIEALGNGFCQFEKGKTRVVFAGQNLSEDYIWELLDAVKNHSIALIVISKSGTTAEPTIAFRILRREMEKRYGKAEAAKRIVAITDGSKGVLKEIADKEGYKILAIPDDVGGRYSVFTPAGLLPIACAGINITELLAGARGIEQATLPEVKFEKNIAAIYAAARNLLYEKGFKIELLALYEPKLKYLAEWWKQLFGESEGKEGKGLFPASTNMTTDLHSLGQYIQDGERILFETVLDVSCPRHRIVIEKEEDDLDGINYLAGKRLSEINAQARLGSLVAHTEGGVPNIGLQILEMTPYFMGALFYFFEKACGISGYMLGVNPFDQPGVEAYKNNMFALLGKSGYEKQGEEIKKKL